MCDARFLIPEITDEDIEWVISAMGIDGFDDFRVEFLKCRSTIDLAACPGSGKTTLIVAKLAILARKWPHPTSGICVLSHTNVAREQIEQRLGGTVVGQRLLAYPHFVDTLHGFVNRFLALPWLYSNGYPSPTIDDDVTTAYRRGVLSHYEFKTVETFLVKKRTSFDRLRICARDLSFGLNGRPFPAKSSSSSFQYAKYAVENAAQAGYYCHDEMFVWAKAMLDDQPHVRDWLARRFPLVIVDEMQDTFDKQVSILDAVFRRRSRQIVVQRVGDPNQEIFDSPNSNCSSSDPFPDSRCSLEIPNSFRFGNEIASLASPLAVRSVGVDGLSGIGPTGLGISPEACRHTIFIFPDKSTCGVLDAFGQHALMVLGNRQVATGVVAAVGHIHRRDSNITPFHDHYPKSVSDYWDGYEPAISRKNPYPSTLAQYIRVAQGLVTDGQTLAPAVDKIATATIELARRMGDIGDLKRKARTHRAVVEALAGRGALLAGYLTLLNRFLVDGVRMSKVSWPNDVREITSVAEALCTSPVDTGKADPFLEWPEDERTLCRESYSSSGTWANVYRVSDNNGTIDVKLGSIHSVKGQTHLATLLLSTYWYGHSSVRLMPWLLGDKANGDGVGNRDIQRLRHAYVAMTRPSHLLCLAIPRSALGGDNTVGQNAAKLRRRGWQLAEIIEGKAQWLE